MANRNCFPRIFEKFLAFHADINDWWHGYKKKLYFDIPILGKKVDYVTEASINTLLLFFLIEQWFCVAQ